MKKEELLILGSTLIASDTIELVLKNNYISQTAEPGQFLHISIPNQTLRRPISIADIDRKTESITIIFKIIGEGTRQLSSYPVGTKIDALGPSGNGFMLDQKSGSTVLLIGGGVGVPPLHYLGKELAKRGVNIISILGYQTERNVFYEEEFSQFGRTFIVTNDGTYGERGFVTDVLDQVEHFDCYYSCGPLPMLQAVTRNLVDYEGFISLEERMGCGVGACFACVIPTDENGGYRKICENGPVFPAQEVTL